MYNYKDATYEETIENITQILKKNNIFVEIKVTSGFDNIYAAYLRVKDTPFYTNGKGTSKEQAIAGAYGELMERLQNRVFFRFNNTFVIEEDEKFIYFPTEQKKEINYIVENREYLGPYFAGLSDEEAKDLIEESLNISSKEEKSSKKILCIPYTKYGSEEKIYLPSEIVKHIYASNGMCAGNSEDEALVEGICEIFERYANKVLLDGRISLPDIPKSIIKQYQRVNSFVEVIKTRGDYEVSFKDCSLGLDLPVVCLIVFDRKCGKYFVKFGAHPVLEVALNRTITELFQGRKIAMSAFWFKETNFEKNADFKKNFRHIFRSGDGEYPIMLFEDEPSYQFNEKWISEEYKDNAQILSALITIIKKNNWILIYNDASYLGFFAYHVIVPEISDISKFDERYIMLYKSRIKINDYLRRLARISDEELLECVEFIKNCDYSINTGLSEFLNIAIRNDDFEDCLLGDIVFFYYLKVEAYDECLKVLDEIIKCCLKMSEKVYYRCLKNYIELVFLSRKDEDSTSKILKKFYKNDLVNKVIGLIHDAKNHFLGFPVLACNKCKECSYGDSCSMRVAYEMDKQILKGWK